MAQEIAIEKTNRLCSDRGIELLEYRGSRCKSKFYQTGYGEFEMVAYYVWVGRRNHPVKTEEDRQRISPRGNNFRVRNSDGIQKRIITNLLKFGHENNTQDSDIAKKNQDKQKVTMLKRYGVEYAVQNEEIFHRMTRKRNQYKMYLSPKFGNIPYQGSYELRYLKSIEGDCDIKSIRRGLRINYIGLDDKLHYYFMDFLVVREEYTEIVEIKSLYYFGDDSNESQKSKKRINLAKKMASEKYALEKNLKCSWRVFDKKGGLCQI